MTDSGNRTNDRFGCRTGDEAYPRAASRGGIVQRPDRSHQDLTGPLQAYARSMAGKPGLLGPALFSLPGHEVSSR